MPDKVNEKWDKEAEKLKENGEDDKKSEDRERTQ